MWLSFRSSNSGVSADQALQVCDVLQALRLCRVAARSLLLHAPHGQDALLPGLQAQLQEALRPQEALGAQPALQGVWRRRHPVAVVRKRVPSLGPGRSTWCERKRARATAPLEAIRATERSAGVVRSDSRVPLSASPWYLCPEPSYAV